jgi:hypothetical protein
MNDAKTPTVSMKDILETIDSGALDPEIARLERALMARKVRATVEQASAGRPAAAASDGALRVGTEVRFNDHVSPKYMTGMRATVVKVLPVNVKVMLTESRGRFHAGKPITCPRGLLDVV